MRRIAICLALAGLVLGGVGCKKGAGGGGTTTGAAASALDLMPETTSFLVGINVTKLTTSNLWTQFSPQFMEQGEVKEGLTKLKEACAFDPTKDITQVVIGADGQASEKSMVVLVKGNFDAGKLEKCATAMAAKEAPEKKFTIKTEGKITTVTEEGGKNAYFGWAGSDTLVVVPAAAEGDKAALEAVLAAKTSAKNNKELGAIMGKVDTTNTIWGALVVPAEGKIKDNVTQSFNQGPPPKAGWMNFAYQKELALEIGGRFATEKDAKDYADKANKELETSKADPTAGPYLKTAKVEAKGTDLVISLKLDEKQVDELVAKVKDFLPFILMGMAGGGGGM